MKFPIDNPNIVNYYLLTHVRALAAACNPSFEE